MGNTKRAILYIYIDAKLKKTLVELTKKQVGVAFLSNTAEKILTAAIQNPSFLTAALGEGVCDQSTN